MYVVPNTALLSIHVTYLFVTAVKFIGFQFGTLLAPLMGCHVVEWPMECGVVGCGGAGLHLTVPVDGNSSQRSEQNQ
jgi:hypothetical protein